jgi:hypothetical protein
VFQGLPGTARGARVVGRSTERMVEIFISMGGVNFVVVGVPSYLSFFQDWNLLSDLYCHTWYLGWILIGRSLEEIVRFRFVVPESDSREENNSDFVASDVLVIDSNKQMRLDRLDQHKVGKSPALCHAFKTDKLLFIST